MSTSDEVHEVQDRDVAHVKRVEAPVWRRWTSVLVVVALGSALSVSWTLPAHGQPPGCNEVGFRESIYTVDEGARSVRLYVGNTHECMVGSVDYETVAGEAQPDEDYEHTSGTLTFQANETEHISIKIFEDTLFEGEETFGVRLSNPQGMIMSRSWATVEISDNDGESASSQSRSTSPVEPSDDGGETSSSADSSGGSSGPNDAPPRPEEPSVDDGRGSTVADRAPTVEGVGVAGDSDTVAGQATDRGAADGWVAALVAGLIVGGLALGGLAGRNRLRHPGS